uniref:Putative secreted protein n=1 Tax=Haematobia irritans TaxID=7368 RepID=A0A1L8EI99_HAEIR
MKHQIFYTTALLLALGAFAVNADLLDCDEQKLPKLSDIPGLGPKVASSEDTGDKVKDTLKDWGCKVKKTASNIGDSVKEKSKQWGDDVAEGFKKLKEKSKDLGSTIETKFHDFKERLSGDSHEHTTSNKDKKFFAENVEMINPDILKADQECGHGHILDALGICKKLRK